MAERALRGDGRGAGQRHGLFHSCPGQRTRRQKGQAGRTRGTTRESESELRRTNRYSLRRRARLDRCHHPTARNAGCPCSPSSLCQPPASERAIPHRSSAGLEGVSSIDCCSHDAQSPSPDEIITPRLNERLHRKFGADRAIHSHRLGQSSINREDHTAFLQRVQHFFRRNVPDQIVLCERASAKPTYGRIEPAASSIVRREDFRRRFHTIAVHVNADFTSRAITDNCTQYATNQVGCCSSYCVRN